LRMRASDQYRNAVGCDRSSSPSPEHWASTSTRSKSRSTYLSMYCAGWVVTVPAANPSVRSTSRSRGMRVAMPSLSHRSARPPVSAATSDALPPGAAQVSSTVSPGRAPSARGGRKLDAFCTKNRPSATAGRAATSPLGAVNVAPSGYQGSGDAATSACASSS
jgi:hypothetical protein